MALWPCHPLSTDPFVTSVTRDMSRVTPAVQDQREGTPLAAYSPPGKEDPKHHGIEVQDHRPETDSLSDPICF